MVTAKQHTYRVTTTCKFHWQIIEPAVGATQKIALLRTALSYEEKLHGGMVA